MAEIVKFNEKHIEDAAGLFVESYKKQRLLVPELPEKHEDTANIMPILKDMVEKYPGVAAVETGKLIGYLTGYLVPEFKGVNRGACCMDYCHAAGGMDRLLIYRRMYATLSQVWIENGYFTHAAMMLANDREAIDTWFMNGFGALCIDAIRSVSPIGIVAPQGVTIRSVNRDNIDDLVSLYHEHKRYMSEAPIFLPLLELDDAGIFKDFFTKHENRIWLSYYNGKPAGYLKVEGKCYGGANIVTDERTIAITGAFVRNEFRRCGIASALLETALTFAGNNGFQRISVDFETSNELGRNFWLRYFKPVCRSLIRYIDERIAWGNSKRDISNMY